VSENTAARRKGKRNEQEYPVEGLRVTDLFVRREESWVESCPKMDEEGQEAQNSGYEINKLWM